MKIGVLGAGMMTEALAARWIQAGHDVLIGGRTAAKTAELAQRIGARAGTLREAAEYGDVILLAVLREGLEQTLRDAGAAEGTLAGKPIVDCGNAVDLADFSQVTWDGRAMAEEVKRLAPGSFVVKAFNMAYAGVWRAPRRIDGRPLAVPFAGDPEAKEVAKRLIGDVGCEPLDAGELSQARHLEAAAIIVIRLLRSGQDLHSAFAWVTAAEAEHRPSAETAIAAAQA